MFSTDVEINKFKYLFKTYAVFFNNKTLRELLDILLIVFVLSSKYINVSIMINYNYASFSSQI